MTLLTDKLLERHAAASMAAMVGGAAAAATVWPSWLLVGSKTKQTSSLSTYTPLIKSCPVTSGHKTDVLRVYL